jgi:hypothetical protein
MTASFEPVGPGSAGERGLPACSPSPDGSSSVMHYAMQYSYARKY